ncbi:MAG: hypothetical protein HZA66_03400 [Rhodopseudomonas palustris]|uniref:Uncharacterized protein n=1 Tax=Rhodopseudomonas palustris TaxID=1076 RepID=A0A933W024_RHOPL|nr:hypothetical protein [Rhodopseudomonas palustris]
MATPNSDRSGAARLRLVTGLCGVAAAAWAALLLPGVWNAAPVESAARRILAGDSFKRDATAGLVEQLARAPLPALRPASLTRAEAVLQLNLAERALATEADAEPRLAAAAAAIDAALAQAPTDAYLWAARYALATSRLGADPAHLPDLVRSYQLGPREGWIALLRHPRGLAVFAQLDPATQQRVVAEFAGLVSAQLTRDAVLALAGLGWPIRDRLLAGLAEVDLEPKQALVKAMRREGVRIEVPGVPEQEERPWR